MSLQDQLDAYKALPKPDFRPEFGQIAGRTIVALIASGQASRALQVGDRAPTFELPDPEGLQMVSTEWLANGPLVVSFYRGVWCPFCNIELKALEAARDAIAARGASLVAISQQTLANNRKSVRENALTFPLLSDRGGEVGCAFGLRWTVPEEMRDVHRQLGGPLPLFNGEDSWTLPMPGRYVIAQDGLIAYAEVNPDYTKRPEPSDLFPVLDRLRMPAVA